MKNISIIINYDNFKVIENILFSENYYWVSNNKTSIFKFFKKEDFPIKFDIDGSETFSWCYLSDKTKSEYEINGNNFLRKYKLKKLI